MSRAGRLAPFLLLVGAVTGCFPFDSPECAVEDPVRPQVDDLDRDGTPAEQDCDDANARIHPGAPEIPSDGIDQDCDGVDTSPTSYDWVCRYPRATLFGDNPGDSSLASATLSPTCGSGAGPSEVFLLLGTVDGQSRVTLEVTSDVPHTLEVWNACYGGGTSLACAGDGAPLALQAGRLESFYVVVTATGEPGPFVLRATEQPLP